MSEIEVGDDERAKRERAAGLAMNPKTGRAYESQGNARNLDRGIGGKFIDGIMVPRSFRCDACEAIVVERKWGDGFPNCGEIFVNPGRYQFMRCGAINLGAGGHFNICGDCVEKAVRAVPNLAGLCAALNGGNLRAR